MKWETDDAKELTVVLKAFKLLNIPHSVQYDELDNEGVWIVEYLEGMENYDNASD